jgi:ATP-dependent helicase/nuclease subunit A
MKNGSATQMQLASRVTEASAGSGKTTELIGSIIAVLKSGASISGVVAVTFTHAAAGEMKLRLRQELETHCNAETDPAIRQRLASSLERLEEAFVGTIHAFCAQLLRQRPVEAGIDPNFKDLSPFESGQLFSYVFRKWLEGRLTADSETLKRAFARLSWLSDKGEDAAKLLRNQAWNLVEWRDLTKPWTLRPFDQRNETDIVLDKLIDIVEEWKIAAGTLTFVPGPLRPAIELAERAGIQRRTACPDYNSWEAELQSLLIRKPTPQDFRFLRDVEIDRKKAIIQRFREFAGDLRHYSERANADFAVRLRDELWPVVEEYQAAKQRGGCLDFSDLLLAARDLMKNDDARQWFQNRYERVFVDEFQDTDPLQAEMLLLLASSDPSEKDWRKVVPAQGKLFAVGDPKQSIYRFRRAEVSLYRRVGQQLIAAGADKRDLKTNFRSNQDLEKFVNAAFSDRIPNYLPLECGRSSIPRQPSVVSLPVPHLQGKRGDVTKGAIEASAPKATAAFVNWLLHQSDWKVTRRDGSLRPIVEGDICILFRRFTPAVTQNYVRELEARSINHILIGSKSLHGREEIIVLRTALTAVEWPDDTLSVFALVRGPLFAIPDQALIKFRQAHGSLNPFKTLPDDLDDEFGPLRFALQLIRDLHKRRNYRPIAATINDLLERTRAHAGFALRPGGERVLANVSRLIDLARRFETATSTSFRSFVEYLQEESEGGEANEAPLLEQDAEGVKLMTVHKAKGLEFPVVILADVTARLTDGDTGDRYVDYDSGLCAQRLLRCAPWDLIEHSASEAQAEREEADRLAYVAATRARDLIVVTAVGTQEWDGWISPLNAAVYPPAQNWHNPQQNTEWCNFGGNDTVLDWDSSLGEVRCIKSGLHAPRLGSHQVLWFNPALLELNKDIADGIADKEILQGDPGPGLVLYDAWKSRRATILENGARHSFQIVVATDAASGEGTKIPVEIISIALSGPRARGRRFGSLVHSVIMDADFDSDPVALQRLAAAHAFRLSSPEEEINSAVGVVSAILQHTILKAAAEAAIAHKEYPFLFRNEHGVIVEGNMDLVYQQDAEWIIVDFKTGPADRKEYRRQLELYGKALQPRPVRAILFEII